MDPSPSAPTAEHADPSTLFVDTQQASAYALYRPTYPPELYRAIYDKAFPGHTPPFTDRTVVDVATGSGQALGPMPQDFSRCIALDVSASQLQALPPHLAARVEAVVGDAHATGLPAASADLVTVGQALHWFRLPEFFRECRRVLKPGGCLAAWTYGFEEMDSFPELQAAFEELYSGSLGPYWAAGRKLVDRQYIDIEPAPEHFERVERVQLPMDAVRDLDQVVGQVRSWSAYTTYLKAHPAGPDPLAAFEATAARLLAVRGLTRGSPLHVRRTLTLLLALMPRPV